MIELSFLSFMMLWTVVLVIGFIFGYFARAYIVPAALITETEDVEDFSKNRR